MKQIKGLFEEIRGSTKHNTFKTYNDKRKLVIMAKKPIPSYTRTNEQDQQRTLFQNAITAWKNLSEEEKQEYAEQARPYALTGYQYFIKLYLLGQIEAGIWYEVTIDNTANSNNLVEYQIRIDISNDAQFFTDAENKREAIRLYDSDKSTLLSYWIEEFDTTNHNAKIWVKVPSIPADGTKTIYISIDTSRTTDASNAEETFVFFDDFESGILSTEWTQHAGDWTVSQDEEGNHYAEVASPESDPPGSYMYVNTFSHNGGYAARGTVKPFTTADPRIVILYDPATKYMFMVDIDVSKSSIKLYENSEGGWTLLDEVSHSYTEGEKILLEIRILEDGTLTATDLTNNISLSATVSPFTGYVAVGTKISVTGGYWDNIQIRKYTAPEPSISYQKET